MKTAVHVLIMAILTCIAAAAFAGPREYLFREKRVCDEEQVLCFRGTMSYDSNPRLIYLRARVRTAPGPGILRIRLAGINELGDRRISPFEVRVRGKYSEIINHKMIPDYPDVQTWRVEFIEFVPEQADD